ncbi:unnamed protein product, partial [Laminaria digitata]
LALVRKFAVCTEVVMLGAAARPRKPRAAAAATAASWTTASSSASKAQAKKKETRPIRGDGGGGSQPLSGGREEPSGRTGEMLRVVDGVCVLLRSYLVVHARDMFVLDKRNNFGGVGGGGGGGGGGGFAAGSAVPGSALPRSALPRSHPDSVGGPSAPSVSVGGGRGESGEEREHVVPALAGQQQQRSASPNVAGLVSRSLSISEALVVRLAKDGVAATGARGGSRGSRGGGSGGGSGGGPRVASFHERESVTVTGLLREVGFRSTSTTFGAGAGAARTGQKVAAGNRTESGSVDMFDMLSRTKMQLCVTLEQGADRVCVYLSLRRECWPAGMIPGYSTVQVEGVCRKLTGNGKSVYLAVSRSGGGTVKVLSLALPPPPPYVPVLGWSSPAPACGPYASAGLGGAQVPGVNDAASTTDCSAVSNVSSSPLLLFPTPATAAAVAAAAAFGVEEGADGSDDLPGEAFVGGFQGSSGGVSTLCRGRGVIKATRDGRALLLDTHPSDAPPSPPQPPAISAPPPPLFVQGWTVPPRSNSGSYPVSSEVQERRRGDSSVARCARGSSPIPAEHTGGNKSTGDERLLSPPPAGGQGSTGEPVAAGSFARNFTDAPDASEAARGKRKCLVPGPFPGPVRGAVLGSAMADFTDAPDAPGAARGKRKCPVSGPVRGAALGPVRAAVLVPVAAAAALPTLGEMCKRGVLVRASRRITCMSVVGVKFAKAATWCRNCGMVRERDLAPGTCWARCDVASNWEVRWEGSANVDDGTGQALLLLDGDDVVKLLKLPAGARQDIEVVARRHGPVAFSGQAFSQSGSGNSALASAARSSPHPLLASARASLGAAATLAGKARGKIAASCVQVVKRAGGDGGSGGGGRGGARGGRAGGYKPAIVDVMGDGMETLTLPNLVLHGSGLEDVGAREEGYGVLARL